MEIISIKKITAIYAGIVIWRTFSLALKRHQLESVSNPVYIRDL